ncbi:ATP-dependent DNA helicase DinG [Shewanella sp. NIFS-20-20]|uniref:ATP-dependent DNA helicase DinG n=1 Tax=Shewanella sp. NIFS-20-20 TaxID=2853806 RepID=UPI001C441008|nr:ATP-dependent DNA helicase DinG [Shewanella sp. NIFS-20-20]MBV7315952.1 ATP-dependent DNA helicase DinG [Shewanella sp. NIFS-20-20]
MLPDTVKTQIRTIYKAVATAMPNFCPRREQNYMVAEIAKTLVGEYDKNRPIIVVEAGTGIGKSLSYILGTIPLALATKKKVCIATATVALQEQLMNKDLPFFKEVSQLDFRYGLAKGRQRYVCLAKLELLCGDANVDQMALWQTKPDNSQVELLQSLLKDYHDKRWNGELDTLPHPLPDHLWQQIACDKHSCQRGHPSHRQCPFHLAREDMDEWDVIIVNHNLLFADLELGGGIILPDPSELYYVIDEAHHLPGVARDFSSAQATLRGSVDWLEKALKTSKKLQDLIKSTQVIAPVQQFQDDAGELARLLTLLAGSLDANPTMFTNIDNRWRFEHGKLPQQLTTIAHDLAKASATTLKQFTRLQSLLNEAIKDGDVAKAQADSLQTDVGFTLQRLENISKLWKMMAKEDNPKGAPMARWIEVISNRQNDFLVCASPIEVGYMLDSMLWEKAAGVVLCSATLRALNKFDHFAHQVGLSLTDGSRYLALDSPFDFKNNATLFLPKMRTEPTEDSYTEELAKLILGLVEDETATLVLFTSYWQMEKVTELVKSKLGQYLLIQGSDSRQALLDKHKQQCDAGKVSILFGTGSFSEGLDLPGDYLTNLIITKLPFSVPTSPVEQAHAEYIKLRGGNPFMQLTIPDASRKLIQSCGRLLRKEQDYGRITILDRRLVTKRYGQSLLDSLPPYRRVIE